MTWPQSWSETITYLRAIYSDLERVREGLGCKFSLVIQYVSTFVSGILVGFYINWRLTGIILIMGPFLIGVSSYIARVRAVSDVRTVLYVEFPMQKISYSRNCWQVSASSSAREQLKYAIAGGIAEEVLANIRTVAAFCKEVVEMKRY